MSTKIDILHHTAESFIDAEIDKIVRLKTLTRLPFIQRICEDLHIFLGNRLKEIYDIEDLIEIRAQVSLISEIINLFFQADEHFSSWWSLPLIRECYEKCGIDYNQRNILIIHSPEIGDYSVYPNITSYLPIKKSEYNPIDVFTIPSEASYDIASISLIAHEVGHVYWSEHVDIIERHLSSYLKEIDKYVELNLFNFQEFNEKIKQLASHIEEYLCDLIGSNLLGPSFDFALLKLFYSLPSDKLQYTPTHPSEISRIELATERLKEYENKNSIKDDDSLSTSLQKLNSVIKNINIRLNLPQYSSQYNRKYTELISKIFKESHIYEFHNQQDILECWHKVLPELNAFRPPLEVVSTCETISPIEALIITTIYYYSEIYKSKNQYYLNAIDQENKDKKLRKILIEHLKYAISLYDFIKAAHARYDTDTTRKLNNNLWNYRTRVSGGKDNPLVITPNIDPKGQYGLNSIDLRLGCSFLVNNPSIYTHIEPKLLSENEEMAERYLFRFFERVNVQPGQQFILHPHQFVLANTLEYISLPFDYYALVLGRSTWGRLGLNIATATTVQAGYRGCLTLELRNLGETPLPLTVGTRICQLCLIKAPADSTGVGYFASGGKYIGPVSAELPRLREDSDWEMLNICCNNSINTQQ